MSSVLHHAVWARRLGASAVPATRRWTVSARHATRTHSGLSSAQASLVRSRPNPAHRLAAAPSTLAFARSFASGASRKVSVWSTCAGHVCVRVPHPVLLACVGEVECVFGAPLCVCGSCGHRCCGWVRCIYVQLLAIRRVQHYTLQHRRYVACASCLGVRDARITLLCSGREVGCTIHGDHGPTVIVDMGTGAWQAPDRLDTGLCSPLLCCSGGCTSTSGSTVKVCLLVASTAGMSTLS